MTNIRCFLFLLCTLSLCPCMLAQPVQSEAEAAALGPKNKLFMDTLNEYRELTKKLTDMKIENQDARPERQAEIEAEYPKLYRQGIETHKKAVEQALDAHDEAPNRNPAVMNLLYSSVVFEFNRENYEEAVRIFKRLATSGIDRNADRFYVFAGLAALLSMNYDEVDEWLNKGLGSGYFRARPCPNGTKPTRGNVPNRGCLEKRARNPKSGN